MPSAWRVVKTKHVATVWDGEAAALYGGRWNSPNGRVVYGSATLSLALVEILVHLPGGMLPSFSAIAVEFDDAIVTSLSIADLPPGFQRAPPQIETMAVGDAWVRSGRSAVLRVPSAIVPLESNYIFNPRHPDFARVTIGRPQSFPLDPRLARG
jgi:RES domain-containing protein